jgi:hypothetical protein
MSSGFEHRTFHKNQYAPAGKIQGEGPESDDGRSEDMLKQYCRWQQNNNNIDITYRLTNDSRGRRATEIRSDGKGDGSLDESASKPHHKRE